MPKFVNEENKKYIYSVLIFTFMYILLLSIDYLQLGASVFYPASFLFVLLYALYMKKNDIFFGYKFTKNSIIASLPALFYINPIGSNMTSFPNSHSLDYVMPSFLLVFVINALLRVVRFKWV